jgi:hypothetical protein
MAVASGLPQLAAGFDCNVKTVQVALIAAIMHTILMQTFTIENYIQPLEFAQFVLFSIFVA